MNYVYKIGLILMITISSLSAVVYEDAEDGNTQGWRVFDKSPRCATISNIMDTDRGSRVIALHGIGVKNGFRIGKKPNKHGSWNNTTDTNLEWSMKTDSNFKLVVLVKTTYEKRYLRYTNMTKFPAKKRRRITTVLPADSIRWYMADFYKRFRSRP
jgi:hypothetical protein